MAMNTIKWTINPFMYVHTLIKAIEFFFYQVLAGKEPLFGGEGKTEKRATSKKNKALLLDS